MFDLTHVNLPMYQIMMALSFLISGYIVWKSLKENKIPDHLILYSLVFTMVCIPFCAKEYTILEHYDQNISFFEAGFSSIGGVIGLLFSAVFFDWIVKVKRHFFLSVYVKVIPLLYSISKLGCFFAGCCFGFEYTHFGSVVYEHGHYFPIQLVESIVFFFIFLYVYRQKRSNISTTIILCSIAKFFLDYFRFNHDGLNFSMNQIMCIPFIFICFYFLWRRRFVHFKVEE